MTYRRTAADLFADDDWITRSLHANAAAYPGLDQKGQAAFLLGDVVYNVSYTLADHHLAGVSFPDVDSLSDIPLTETGHRAFSFDVALGESDIPNSENRLAAIRMTLTNLAEIANPPLRLYTGLSSAAQWRLVGDSTAFGFLYAGQQQNCERAAVRDARRVLSGITSQFTGNHTRFTYQPIADALGNHYQVKRGGCCRYYLSDAGNHCETCVLTNPKRRERFVLPAVTYTINANG